MTFFPIRLSCLFPTCLCCTWVTRYFQGLRPSTLRFENRGRRGCGPCRPSPTPPAPEPGPLQSFKHLQAQPPRRPKPPRQMHVRLCPWGSKREPPGPGPVEGGNVHHTRGHCKALCSDHRLPADLSPLPGAQKGPVRGGGASRGSHKALLQRGDKCHAKNVRDQDQNKPPALPARLPREGHCRSGLRPQERRPWPNAASSREQQRRFHP